MPKQELVEFDTSLDLNQIKRIFSDTVAGLHRKVEFGPIQASDNPFDDSDDFSAFASLSTLTGGWVVQIYINDDGDSRRVRLAALGSGGVGRAVGGLKNTVSISKSREIILGVLAKLRSADSGITV